MKRCNKCGEPKSLSEYHKKHDNADGHSNECKVCHRNNKYYKNRGKARNIYPRTGGPYRVIYDPCNSFTIGSSFRRSEIMDMLNSEYLAIGTRFRRDGCELEVRVHGNTGALKLSVCNTYGISEG